MIQTRTIPVPLVLFLLSCMEDSKLSPRGRLSTAVAPLQLPGLSRVCYDLLVTSGASASDPVVWDREEVCSDDFGNGPSGDITYVGVCDASPVAAGDTSRTNSVTIWVASLHGTDGSPIAPSGPDGWQDPCPTGCTLPVECTENQDTRVEFNLTILRQANQGFFDIGVNFADIFCSAKLDTCYPAGGPGTSDDRPIELLHGDGATRDWTAVMGLACTAGPDANATHLYYGNIDIDCGSAENLRLDLSQRGNQIATTSGGTSVRYAVYRGTEQLNCGTGSCRKSYWNIAVSLDDLSAFEQLCRISLTATAADGSVPSAAGSSYPYVVLDAVALTTVDGSPFCQSNALDGGGALLTEYRGLLGGLEPPASLCWRYDGLSASPTGDPVCNSSNSLACLPSAEPELCNGLDENCNGSTDEGADASCPAVANGTAACSSGTCGIGGCLGTYLNCDSLSGNGCETNTASDLNHCGQCGKTCTFSNAVASCSSGSCALSSCTSGYGNCDNVSSNGCEANLLTSVATCGSCSNACASGQSCYAGQCAATCANEEALTFPFVQGCIDIAKGQTYSASSTYYTATPAKAADGNNCTIWNSGNYAPQYWRVDFGTATNNIRGVTLRTAMSPNGSVTLAIETSLDGTTWIARTSVTQNMVNQNNYSYDFGAGITARYVRVRTTSSPSWVAWAEIAIFRC